MAKQVNKIADAMLSEALGAAKVQGALATAAATPPGKQTIRLHMTVEYELTQFDNLADHIASVKELIDNANGCGSVIRAALTGLPPVVMLEGDE